MSDMEDYTSETDDSYDDSYDEEEEDFEDAEDAKSEWDEFFSKYREKSNEATSSEGTGFKPTTPILAALESVELTPNEIEEAKSPKEPEEDSPTASVEEKEEKKEEEPEEKDEEPAPEPEPVEEEPGLSPPAAHVASILEEKKKEFVEPSPSPSPKDKAVAPVEDNQQKSTEPLPEDTKTGNSSGSHKKLKRHKQERSIMNKLKSPGSDTESSDSEGKGRRSKSRRSTKSGSATAAADPEEIKEDEQITKETIAAPKPQKPITALKDVEADKKRSFLRGRFKIKKDKEKDRISSQYSASKDEQRDAASRIQANIRGFLLRRRLASLPGSPSVLLKQLIALRQISEVETTYVSNLSVIIESYLRPLMEFNRLSEEARKALPVVVVKAIFRNIEVIYNLHVEQLRTLQQRLDAWPFVSDLPAVFLKATASYSVYSRYAEDAAAAEETLRFYKQNPPLSTFLSKMYDERMRNADLPARQKLPHLYALLVLPYKHLIKLHTAYSIFMSATPHTTPDYELLADSVAILSQLKTFIWETAEAEISKRKMTILAKKIQSANSNTASNPISEPRVIQLNPAQPLSPESLHATPKKKSKRSKDKKEKRKKRKKSKGNTMEKEEREKDNSPPFHFELYEKNRKLIRNGILLVGAQKRNVFLFNDVCLILEVFASNSSRFEAVFNLHDAEVHSKSVSLTDNSQTFRVRCSAGDFMFTETLDSEDGEVSWNQTFEERINLAKDKIFGASLEEVVKRENSAIPSVVLNIIQSLNKNVANPELFKSTFAAKSVQSLRDPSTHRKLNNSKISDVEGLFILYLEQLPEPLIRYESRDPIFTAQSIPNEKTLLEWVRKQLAEMPLCSRNLLEYVMSFLSKVLARSASNNLTSTDLSVIFSPLVFRPEKLTLEFCYRMARVVRLVRIMIERAGDLFRTVDNDSFPLPKTLEEFLDADQFGQWWRDFRQKKDYFVDYMATPKLIGEVVSHILHIPDLEESEEHKTATKYASMAYGILVNDGVIGAMFEKEELLRVVMQEFDGQRVNERSNKYFCDFVEVLLRANPQRMTQFLTANQDMNRKIVHSIGSGNFCNMILSVAESWQMSEYVHLIVVNWGVIGLELYLEAEETSDSDQLANTVRFLRFLVRTTTFVGSAASAPFVALLQDHDYASKMISKAINSSDDTCVCTIPLVIEILVQNKNRNPGKSPLDSIVLKAPDSASMTDEERNEYEEKAKAAYELLQDQLREDVPFVIINLLERHEGIVTKMGTSPGDEDRLGFFRFGLVKLVQAMLVTNYPYGNSYLAKCSLVDACLQLFFRYYKHSILHSVIAYIVRYIMAMGNRDLVEMLLIRLDLPGQIVDVFALEGTEGEEKLVFLRGYLKMLSVAIRNSSLAEQLLRNNSKWNDFVEDVLLNDDRKQSQTDSSSEVKAAQKKIARSNLTKDGLTDKVEDKLG